LIHLVLHCFDDFLFSSDATLAHWFFPYFIIADLRISSSLFFHEPPFTVSRTITWVGGVVVARVA